MITKKVLKNGIRLLLEPLPYVESAAIGIWVNAGSADELPHESGISHVVEHMLFKGTERRTAQELAADTDAIGANANAFTGKESTCYYMRTLSSHVEEATEILLDMFLHSKFDPKELEREKTVIFEEMKMYEDTPDDLAHELLMQSVFRGTNLAPDVLGTRETVGAITREDILAYRKREYSPGKILISASGNFDPNRLTEIFDRALGWIDAPEAERRETPLLYTPEAICKVKDVEQSNICMGMPGITATDPLYYPLHLLSGILGGAMSSRLFQEIREKRGLAYSVFSADHSFTNHGVFEIYAGVGHEKVEETIRAIAEVLRDLKANRVTERELRNVREQMKASLVFSRESINARMIANGRSELVLGAVLTEEEILKKTDAVTMEQIDEAVELVADPSRYSVALVGDRNHPLRTYLDA